MAFANEPAGAKTPSPPSTIRTPPAPQLGFHDSWEPYSPPRKSARLSSQRAANRTPSPRASHRQQPGSPRTAKKSLAQTGAPMVSPVTSPRKRSHPALDSRRQVSSSLTAEGTANAAVALGLNVDKGVQRSTTASVSQSAGMLPTPSKTPQKPPNEKTAASIQSFARNLFSSEEEVLPSPRKRRSKKYSGVTMESFTAEEEEDPITIFTDSQDRIPEKDNSEANPFYGSTAMAAEPSKRQSRRKVVSIPGEGAQSIDEAARREDGIVYVFRGKKFFRKFSEQDQSEEIAASAEDDESRLNRPLTRASVKPRLLFPTQKTTAEDDEEALTDVEDMNLIDEHVPQTPMKAHSIPAKTPEAPKYAPVSPPDTRRTTRSTNKLADTPMKGTGRKSPFDSWPRTKEHKSQSPAPKRAGESLASETTKRTRA
ncbi:hypothetical protein X797_000429 [Metarhizium robertsii]|uniref:Uncharacterized protein n=2 Tax=Metarhizium robertsii TaxID=568076 RepID=E9EQ49_METRA|nr:uncharacterized protein MAA_02095 [Metarhizium robertsii ARSEF 23]EFZ02513.1 hypothetical protein MAA_02095 [Metarhizium robertsii ARSEF 23]EXV05712.1 hypothetical protein X797_000429 [Metarhizium robertsii]